MESKKTILESYDDFLEEQGKTSKMDRGTCRENLCDCCGRKYDCKIIQHLIEFCLKEDASAIITRCESNVVNSQE